MFTINHVPVKSGTVEQVEQFGQLMKGDHRDMLVAFGQDCASAGYKRGVRDSAIAACIGVAVMATIGLFKNYRQKRKLEKAIKDFHEYVEAEVEIVLDK